MLLRHNDPNSYAGGDLGPCGLNRTGLIGRGIETRQRTAPGLPGWGLALG